MTVCGLGLDSTAVPSRTEPTSNAHSSISRPDTILRPPATKGEQTVNTSPGFCEKCGNALDPADTRPYCWQCDFREWDPMWNYEDGDPTWWLYEAWIAQQDSTTIPARRSPVVGSRTGNGHDLTGIDGGLTGI